MIFPKQLQKGDTIAIVSPSWGGPSVFPKVLDAGIAMLHELGLMVKEMPHCRFSPDELHKNPELRAADINDAFADPDVKGIMASIGGDDAVRILKYLDIDTILNNPKLIMGYSDTSAILSYLNVKGLITFNGPAIMSGWAQMSSFSAEYRNYIENFLFGFNAVRLPFFTEYSEGYPDWGGRESVGAINTQKITDGWHWIHKPDSVSVVSGELWGGCMDVLEMLKGTEFWPDATFWKGKVLFFETSEEKPGLDTVKYWLRNYGAMGALQNASAVLFGRAMHYSDTEKAELDKVILSVIRDEFACSDVAIITNMDFGHTDPQLIMPLGCSVEVNCTDEIIGLAESPFAWPE